MFTLYVISGKKGGDLAVGISRGNPSITVISIPFSLVTPEEIPEFVEGSPTPNKRRDWGWAYWT